ncbi:MAG TPA: PAS domain S-box protein [Acidobacteriota bacterium]|nr:PAS domain S-box protein [Acidobacteriota bacterium]
MSGVESFIEFLHIPSLVLTDEMHIRSVNEAFCSQFQLARNDCLGQRFNDLENGLWDSPELHHLLEERLEDENAVHDCEIRQAIDQTGERILLISACRVGDGRHTLIMAQDITQQRQYEELLRERESRYRSLFETIDEGFCVFEVLFEGEKPIDYRFLETNPGFDKLTGLHGAVGKCIRELRPQHEEHWFQIYGQVAVTGKPLRFTQQAKHLGGRWYDVYAFRIGPAEQRQVAVLFDDITEKKKAQEILRESEERFRAVAELVPDLLWRSDPDGKSTWYNQRWMEYTGQTRVQAAGYGWIDVIHPDDRSRSLDNYERAVRTGQPLQQEHRIRRHDGVYRWFLVRAEPVRDVEGKILHWFGAATDVHEQRAAVESLEWRVEKRTRQVRRLAYRLTMAEHKERQRITRVLHDNLQQLLYGVEMRLRMVSQSLLATQDKMSGLLDETNRWVREAILTTRNLTTDLCPPALEKDELGDALRWLKRQMKELHGLEIDIDKQSCLSIQDNELRILLFHSVRELLFNVVKHAGVNRATVRLEEDEKYSIIHVIDDGCGFNAAEVTGGEEDVSGFGLFSIRERLRLIGGYVEIHSTPGYGTHIQIRAPRDRAVQGTR